MVHFFLKKKKKPLQNIIRYSKNMTFKKPNSSNNKKKVLKSHTGEWREKKKGPSYPSLFPCVLRKKQATPVTDL